MKVVVCGDRNWEGPILIWNWLSALKAEHGVFTVIEGGAAGADWHAKQAARGLGLPVETYGANWKLFGRRAGPMRNRQMLDQKPERVVAFHNNLEKSRGTRDCVTEARRRGIPVEVITSRVPA